MSGPAPGDTGPLTLDPRLWMLLSPALPVGGYSYSQGLEYAVAAGWVHDFASARDWILGLADTALPCVDLPLLLRLHAAFHAADSGAVQYWNAWLLASRESAELQREDLNMGAALRRLLQQLEGTEALPYLPAEPAFAASFAGVCCGWQIDATSACAGYGWVWAENQIAAAVKLVPLGQSDGQRLLLEISGRLPAMVSRAGQLPDHDLGLTAPGLGIASARHETQYTRLFRS